MRRWLTVALLLVILGLSALAVSCASPVEKQEIRYFYDEAHNVSIWLVGTTTGVAISVLPGSQVKNPQRPAEIIKP